MNEDGKPSFFVARKCESTLDNTPIKAYYINTPIRAHFGGGIL